jgi:histidine ammonia-lyase
MVIDGQPVSLAAVAAVALDRQWVELGPAARSRMARSRATVERLVATATPAYGITTGIGSLSDRVIPPDRARELQVNLLLSHATGAGDPLPTDAVRAAMLLRAVSLARGHSGVRPVVVDSLLAFLNAGVHPVVPCQGSLGASGDLAPLAHLALPLIGLGTVEIEGARLDGDAASRISGIEPLTLEPKEALALINGTQVMTALDTLALLRGERLLASAIAVAALSCCALAARRAPFDPRIHEVRPHPGQQAVAANMRALLAPVPEPPPLTARIQDPYSLRCIPQVYGAIQDALRPLRDTLAIEVNAVTDNPLIFDGDLLSGGNFHGHPLALSADAAKTAVASLGTMVERRIALLVDSEDRGLPACLTRQPGLSSGYMIAHYLAAGLVTENRVLAHPASVDSLPVSAGIEDYNSMGSIAARHLGQVVANVETIVAIEALCAAQACDLADRVPAGPLGRLYDRLRERVPALNGDTRVIAGDVAAATALLREGQLDVTDELLEKDA